MKKLVKPQEDVKEELVETLCSENSGSCGILAYADDENDDEIIF